MSEYIDVPPMAANVMGIPAGRYRADDVPPCGFPKEAVHVTVNDDRTESSHNTPEKKEKK